MDPTSERVGERMSEGREWGPVSEGGRVAKGEIDKRTKKTRPHGGGVLADSPERLDLEGGALQFADVEVLLWLGICAVVAGRS